MSNQLALIEADDLILEIQDTQKVCKALLQAPHYQKMGKEGVFAIVAKAKSIGVSPMEALNGGFYFVQGKVEMTSSMMNHLIRANGHSITKDKRSNDTICILHGKRKDNGDTWVESFSLADAKRAGIYRNQWVKYPKDMLFARALSRLARQLYPDVIKGCYVEGEIGDPTHLLSEHISTTTEEEESLKEPESSLTCEVSDEEFEVLNEWLGENHQLKVNILSCLKKENIDDLRAIPRKFYALALQRAKEQFIESQEVSGEQMQMGGA